MAGIRKGRTAGDRLAKWLAPTAALVTAATLLLTGGCARANLPPLPPPAKKLLEITFWMNDTIDAKWFYFVAIEMDDDQQGPMPEVSGTDRARNWTDYFLYTNNSQLTGGNPTFLYAKISPENDPASILQVPTRLDRQPFYVGADLQSRNVQFQTRTNNAIHLLFDLDAFTQRTGATTHFTQFNIQFVVASSGVDQITNPPNPPEVSHTLDALDVPYMNVPSLTTGIVYRSDFTPNERIGEAPLGAVDIAGWEIKVR